MNRRSGGYRSRGTGMGISAFLLAVIVAVSMGYVGTKYVIYPFFLQEKNSVSNVTEPAVEKEKDQEKVTPVTEEKKPTEKKILEDKQEIKAIPVYSLQFGVYSDQDSAASKIKELESKGINGYIYEGTEDYKVLGNAYANKEKAKSAVEFISKGGIEVVLLENDPT
ncbi:MAG: SPOR domain-containing protein [Anaerovorax sp.]